MAPEYSGPEHLQGEQSPITGWPFVERRVAKHDASIGQLQERYDTLQRLVDGVNVKIDLLVSQLTKIALLEQTQSTHQTEITRAFSKIESLSSKHDDLDKEFHSVLNKGLGAWALFAGIVFVTGYSGKDMLDTARQEKKEIVSRMENLQQQVTYIDDRLREFSRTARPPQAR